MYLRQLFHETSFQLHMFICGYGHVILNAFLPVGCVQKGLKATTLGSFPMVFDIVRKREHQRKNLVKSLENT